MSDKVDATSSDFMPLRAPQRWFKCIEYESGLKIELPFADEQEAVAAGIAHLKLDLRGTVKVGYYGFRSRVIVYAAPELAALSTL
jgi:hypothetical protein